MTKWINRIQLKKKNDYSVGKATFGYIIREGKNKFIYATESNKIDTKVDIKPIRKIEFSFYAHD